MRKISVLNPMGNAPAVVPKSMAPRLPTLEGKVVYLVDSRMDDGYRLLQQLQQWFSDHAPATETRLVQFPSVYWGEYPELWEEIRQGGDAAILAVGH